jgi:nitrogen regulatory protein P-II 1
MKGEIDMIKIEAVIRPERVSQVSAAIQDAGCGGFHYLNVTGQGQQHGVEVFTGRGGRTATRAAMPKTILIEAIINSARSEGEPAIGDGKIFISPVTDVVRVRTGERGEAAI